MTSEYNFQKAREVWGDGVVAPTHRVFQEWLKNPLTKALKQTHKIKVESLEERIEKLETMLAQAVWNYGELKRKEWVGLTEQERYLNECRSKEEIDYACAIEAKLKEKNT